LVKLIKSLINKAKVLFVEDPQKAADLAYDLSDIYLEIDDYKKVIEDFLHDKTNSLEALGDILIKLESSIHHIEYHIKQVAGPLEQAIIICFPADEDSEQ
jgi:hypothetical protein